MSSILRGGACAVVLVGIVISNVACDGVFKFSDTGVFGFGTDDSATTEEEVTPTDDDGVEGALTGTVTVQPYTTDENGDIVYVDWEEASGGSFNYGNIFVAAYTVDEVTGQQEYHDTTTILSPSTEGDAYELDLEVDDASAVRVYATLDYWGDGVLGSSEPIGLYPEALSPADGELLTDIDITILAHVKSSGGGGCDTVDISGNVFITVGYVAGEVGVMLQNSAGDGPINSSVGWTVPLGDADGATSEYSFSVCDSPGEVRLIGGWDKNYNRLLDPTDRWGVYMAEEKVDGNPITVGTSDLSGYDVYIPFGDSAAFATVPFVVLSGKVTMQGADTFDALPTHSSLHVAALKYQPASDISVSSLADDTYDLVEFDWSELSGQTEVSFSLVVPSNTTLYLWTFADTDGDGVLNEADEPIAAAGTDGGRVSVGTTNETDQDMEVPADGGVE